MGVAQRWRDYTVALSRSLAGAGGGAAPQGAAAVQAPAPADPERDDAPASDGPAGNTAEASTMQDQNIMIRYRTMLRCRIISQYGR